MDPKSWHDVERLFLAAIELDARERITLLDEECAGRDDLRREVQAMLEAHGEEPRLAIEKRLIRDGEVPATAPGTRLGPYRILRLLGRGGMGEVHLAVRDDDLYKKEVAVKIMRPGLHSTDMLDRFRQERQILAGLEHPAIASLLDGGVSDDGRPYLVMQYVDGEPITEACDRRRMSIRDRVQLFATVCRAVQYAHSKLIVHRDLKPSNLLVTAEGEPKLLDFGIAKLLDPEGVEVPAAETRVGVRVLTPERAAPEQLRGEAVSAATDVYALGMLLHELLTGRLPYRLEADSSSAIEEALSTVAAARPSAHFGRRRGRTAKGDEDDLEARSRARGARPERLRRQLEGDLERIVLMALRPEPERRYASAGQLGEDLERFLNGAPVMARPDTLGYRTRRFVGRHPAGTAAALLLVGVLGVSAITANLQARRVAAERDRAEVERRNAEQVVELLVDFFETSDPIDGPGGDEIPVGDFLEQAEARVDELETQPEVQARLLHVLGRIHRLRSRYDDADRLLRRSLELQIDLRGEDDGQAVAIAHELGLNLVASGDRSAGRDELRASVARHRRVYGDRDATLAEALTDLAAVEEEDRQLELLEEALAIQRSLFEEPHSAIANSLNQLGIFHNDRGRKADARRFFEQSLAMMVELHGESHPQVATLMNNLAITLGDPAEAEALQRRKLAIDLTVFGERSNQVARTWNNIGVSLLQQGRHREGEEALKRSLDTWIAIVGEEHYQVANTRRNLGRTAQLQRRYPEAVALLDQAAATFSTVTGPDSRVTTYAQAQAAVVRDRLGEHERSRAELNDALRKLRQTTPEAGHPYVADVLLWLGDAQVRAGLGSEGERSLEEALALREKLYAGDDPRQAEARSMIGLARLARDPDEAARSQLARDLPKLESWGLADPELLDRIRSSLE